MNVLFLIFLNGTMLPDTVMQAVNVLLDLTFTWAYMYFSEFVPMFEMHCGAQVYIHIILFNAALVQRTKHLPNNRKYIS